ncbi:hypothetical protein DL766_005246 [Monosporascus sp. MC13-8B]|uniref:DUF7582 domain-containing protein n=1 Tax=Monosporascus cannonballus TaxID=155416 RepID=A0ABY0GWT6_9PEZI|nr:hypothetical protein DL762_008328 [Monosporascus cannonballus]RYP29691.1 hypothetical protein DL766_005246 [Monosporascus sp. MC13-8B]
MHNGTVLVAAAANTQRKNPSRTCTSKDPGHDDPIPTYNRETLLTALHNVAAYINKRGGHVTIVAVGGAVNTIYLQSRATAHDIDFFNEFMTWKESEILLNGAKNALKHDKSLQKQWFNNRTIFFIPRDKRVMLTQEAFKQQDVMFSENGLTMLAAPWKYAFCCKVCRIAGESIHSARPYDLDDAVQYLYRYQYSLRWTSSNGTVIAQVNQKYRLLFKVTYDVIV